MKKIISLILTLAIFTSVIYPCHSVVAQEMKLDNILSIGQDISKMCKEYDKDCFEKTKSSSNDDKTIDTRLIVKANDIIHEYGAVDSVYGFGYAFLQYADKDAAEYAKRKYENSGCIVDYDYVISTASTSINTGDNQSDEWAYEETDAFSAVDYYKSKIKSNINIAVIDSGINYNHELFKNRVVRTNVDFSSEATGDEMDKYGHGTNVAGAIAKSTPSNVKISAYKFYDSKGNGTASEALSALEYIKQLSNKPDIINCSFVTRSGLGTIIDELVDMGVTVVAGAGNEGKEVYQQPAIFDSVITVAATNRYGNAWSSSNYGACVDISAPGYYVYTADMSSTTAYEFASGTSLATPLVSAAAAYVLMEHKNYTPEQVKQELIETVTPFKKSSCYYDRYGAGIVNFSNIINGTRCKEVTANYISGAYRDNISVELKCANTLVDIYYTTDGTLPTETNGIKYSVPINLTESTRIIAAAFARAGTPMHSKFTYLDYYILEDGESELIIDDNGIIKAYLGNDTNLVVPEEVNGVTPVSIGENCFRNSNIESIALPDTVNNLLSHSFYGCDKLSNINLSNIKYIGKEALSGCSSLTQDVELSSVEYIDERGLAGTYFKSVKLPKCVQADDYAFENCAARDIVLNNATTLGNNAFYNCKNLENLYVPKVKGLGSGFEGCTNIKIIFAPKTTYITLSIPNNTTIYCSDKLTGVDFLDEYKDFKYTFISPDYTPGLNAADREGYTDRFTRVNSDEFGISKGAQIRTRDNGLRFGFSFDESNIGFDFRKYAQNIDYGFVYTFNSLNGQNDFQKNLNLRANKTSVLVKSADKRNVEGTISTYNAVFTGITPSHFADEISARAYVNIDGMYFYSPVTIRSFNDVATKIIADDKIDQNTKNEVKTLLEKEV